MSYIALWGIYIFSACYYRTIPRKAFQKKEEDILLVKIEPQKQEEKKEEGVIGKVEEGVRENRRQTRSYFASISGLFITLWKMTTLSPYILMQIVRLVLTLWVVKYSTYFNGIILIWVYYSICYKDHNWFCKYPPMFLLPSLAIQIIGTKLVNIPDIIDPKWRYTKQLENFGFFPFQFDSTISSTYEFGWMMAGFLFTCGTYKMCQFVDRYTQWETETAVNYYVIINK